MSHHHSSGPQSEASRALRSWSRQRAASLGSGQQGRSSGQQSPAASRAQGEAGRAGLESGPTLLASAGALREAHKVPRAAQRRPDDDDDDPKAPSAVERRGLVTQEQLDDALDALRREFRQQLEAARRPGDGLAQGVPAVVGANPEPFGTGVGAGDRGSELANTASEQGGASQEGRELVATTVFDIDCELAITAARHGGASQETTTKKSGAESCPPRDEERALTESIWDAAMLIGCTGVGLHGSLFTAATFVLNALIQFGFCVIVNDSLTRPRIDAATVADFTDWRTTVAHNLKYVNDLTLQSMARKVCTFGDTPMAAGPIEGLSAISEYQPNPGDRQYRADPPLGYWMPSQHVGEAMCLLSLIVWWLSVLKEIFSIISLGQALYSLPSGGGTKLSDTAGRLALMSMSRIRKATVVGVLIVRSFICLTLAVCGTLYLASTISLGDLLLNALALEIVLSLDELTFEVLVPRSARLMISSLAPLARPPSRAWRGLDARPVAASIAIVAGLVCVHLFVLRDQSQLLRDAREALCGGDLDFIATIDQTGLVVAYNERSTADYTSSYEYRTFRTLVQNRSESATEYLDGSSSRRAYGFSGSRTSLKGLSELSMSDMTAKFNGGCWDMDYPGSQIWPTLSDILGSADSRGPEADLANFSSCADVAPKCAEASTLGVRARQYCPVTCGCHDPAAALVLSSAEEGCPQSCAETKLYTQAVGSLSCADWTLWSPQTLGGIDLLGAYVEGLRQAGWPALYFGEWIESFELLMKMGGCPALMQLMSSDDWALGNLCEETNWYQFRPITALCPVSCGCTDSGGLFCPTTC